MKTEQRLLILGILLSTAVGASAGIVSSVSTSRAIDSYAAKLLEDQKFISLSPRKGASYPGTYDDSLKVLREETLRSLAVVLPVSQDSLLPGSWIFPKDSTKAGVVVSADGWVLFTSATFPKEANSKAVDVWVDHKRYAIERVVRDTGSPLVLLKLSGASGLPAVSFGASADEVSGSMLFAGLSQDEVEPVVLISADETILNGVLPAETFATNWRLQTAFEAGTPLFSSSGGLNGFALSADGDAFPLHHSKGFVQDVVRTGGARAAVLGAYTLDLSRAYNVDPSLKADRVQGALIISPGGEKPALLETGPVKKGVLVSGDIILDVDGEAVTYSRTLAEILADYEPGEIANIRILRKGETSVVAITLGDAATLAY